MEAFDRTGLDHQPVRDAGIQRVGYGALDRGMHAGDTRTVGKVFGGYGIRLRNQVPDGMRIFVRLDIREGNDLHAGEFEPPIEAKSDGINQRIVCGAFSTQQGSPDRPGAMINLNIIFREPVSIQVKGKAAQDDGKPQP